MKSQFVISSEEDENTHGGRRQLLFVFTEQRIAMYAFSLLVDLVIKAETKLVLADSVKTILEGDFDGLYRRASSN